MVSDLTFTCKRKHAAHIILANRNADKVCRSHCRFVYLWKPTPCHTDPLLLSTMRRCVATEIEIMIMCPSDCIKVLPLQKKPGGMKCKWQCGADGLSVVALASMNLKGDVGCDRVCVCASVCVRQVTGCQSVDYRGYFQVFCLCLAHRLIITKVIAWAVLGSVVFGLDTVCASCVYAV